MENAMNKRSFLSGLFVCTLLISLVSATCHARDATSFDPRKIHVEAVNVGGGVPIGTIVAWPVATNPSDWEKWLECNGQAIDAAVYPELAALYAPHGGRVPDLRGMFLRGHGHLPTMEPLPTPPAAWGNSRVIQSLILLSLLIFKLTILIFLLFQFFL
jgi:hypothetical protein